MSHTAVWNVIEKLGSKIEEKEERKILLNKQGKLNGTKEAYVVENKIAWASFESSKKFKEAHKLIKMLNIGQVEESFEYITNLMIKYTNDENKFKKLEKLYTYFFDNKIGLKLDLCQYIGHKKLNFVMQF